MSNRIVFGAAALAVIAGSFALSCGGKSSSPTSPAPTIELNSGPIAPGSSYAHTFTNPGVYNHHCTIIGPRRDDRHGDRDERRVAHERRGAVRRQLYGRDRRAELQRGQQR